MQPVERKIPPVAFEDLHMVSAFKKKVMIHGSEAETQIIFDQTCSNEMIT